MAGQISTYLLFEGCAEEAMNLYTSLFDNSSITKLEKYGPDAQGPEGSVYLAYFTLNGREFMCIDSPVAHDFKFTPSMSLFIECDSEAEQMKLCDALGEGGDFLMPLDNYGFSQKFAWLNDKFGVSWQINLA